MREAYTFGPEIRDDAVLFRLWAPLAEQVTLRIDQRGDWTMQPREGGWHVLKMQQARPGDLYKFILPDGLEVPDPASRFQPADVHGPSEVVQPQFAWSRADWKGRPGEEMIVYELHIGAFTQAGTFSSAMERLDYLQSLGVTAIQLMPLSDFPGRYGWGYDGVLPYAPDSSYGRPEDLKRLVDAAHERGICVFLDVVYNHFGPDGNYLPSYAPIFSARHESPWGKGLNFDGEGGRQVRNFVIENAIYWIGEFRMDGLRLDAVHAMKDNSDRHILIELAERVRRSFPDRHIHLILENEDNDSALLARKPDGEAWHFTAQWNDDIHHALHAAATGETFGYYGDYADWLPRARRSLAEGFAFQGEHMAYRQRSRGKPSTSLPPTAFLSFIQNHDQIGNRAKGDRMVASHPAEAMKAIAAIYLLAPQVPMLFMGEEWGCTQPFPFFCDFDEELNDKVRLGRKEELRRLPGFDAKDAVDPASDATFHSAKLQWDKLQADQTFGQHYRDLIRLRHQKIMPLLGQRPVHATVHDTDSPLLRVSWQMGQSTLRLTANLSDRPVTISVPTGDAVLFICGNIAGDELEPWSVIWDLAE